MFAPDPARSSKKLWYRVRTGINEWSEWYDPAESSLQAYQYWRVTYRGQILWLHHSIVTNLLRKYDAIGIELAASNVSAAQLQTASMRLLELSSEYEVARRYIVDVVRETNQFNAASEIEFAYVSVSPPQFSNRRTSELPQLNYFVFPSIKLDFKK